MKGDNLPRGIRRRGQVLFVDASYKGKRATATVASGNLEEAKAKQAALRNQLMNGVATEEDAPQSTAWTLDEATARCREVEWAGSKGEKSALINSQAALDHFGGDRPLDRITTSSLDDYAAALAVGGNSAGTINRKFAALSKVMSCAIDRGGLLAKPKFPRKKEFAGRIRFITEDEEAMFLSTCEKLGWQDFGDVVAVLIDTGLRRGELVRLTVRDADLVNKVINVWETKTGNAQSVPLTQRAFKIAERWCQQTNDRLVKFTLTQLRHKWDYVRSLLGLGDDPQFVLHVCRHTCASRLVQRGAPLVVIKEWMGHKAIQTTMRYAH